MDTLGAAWLLEDHSRVNQSYGIPFAKVLSGFRLDRGGSREIKVAGLIGATSPPRVFKFGSSLKRVI